MKSSRASGPATRRTTIRQPCDSIVAATGWDDTSILWAATGAGFMLAQYALSARPAVNQSPPDVRETSGGLYQTLVGWVSSV
jgi:hypothetical protein